MIKLSDYIFNFLSERGINTVFMVTGGAAMHLNDSIGRNKKLKYVCNHNEQASSIAAEGYARVTNIPAIVNVTAGPGGINAINGVFGAFTDSIPMIIVSGQAKRETLLRTYDMPGLRQLGDQEVDIVAMVKGVTKFAVVLQDPADVRYVLEKALFLATNGRPGPCWIDVPVDVQATMIDENQLRSFDIEHEKSIKNMDSIELEETYETIIEKIVKAKRPVIIGSTGVRLSGAIDAFYQFAESTGIPVTTAWCHDIFHYDHPQYIGKQGTIGDRAGNFAVQNADLVIILGSRMPIRQVSYNWENFARHAYKIQIDIDAAELKKPTMKADLTIEADLKEFLVGINNFIKTSGVSLPDFSEWLKWNQVRKNKYPVLQDHHKIPERPINPYYFLHSLHSLLNERDVIVCGDATACIVTFQTSRIKRGQILFSNSGCASMGYDVPAAIGAAIARPDQRIICIAGDGSMQMNIQELQTIVHHNLNIKIFVMDNNGYLSIKSTQNSFFGLSVGSHGQSGVSFPDMEKIGRAYGIKSVTLNEFDFTGELGKLLNEDGPLICNVKLDIMQTFEPKLSSKRLPDGRMVSAPLEDMFPFLSEEELKSNMLVPTLKF